tara:strand:+ start:278 stop:415 length:138 start_codon:yes stop_codon:yes gene_type:complete
MDKESLEHEVVSKGVFRGGLSVEKNSFSPTPGQMRIDDERDFSRI